jgi:hypothetical protein
MRPELDFGPLDGTVEADRVESILSGQVICSRCGATLDDYADKCSAPLESPCPGFLLVEGARLHIRRMADG